MVFSCIILAAGEGSRIGKCKAALPFGSSGETLLSHIISTYVNTEISNILIITGNWRKETFTAAQYFSSTVKFIDNDNPNLGMFSSVRKGALSVESCIKYFFVHPVDIPLVKEDTIIKMKRRALNSKNRKAWVTPKYNDEEGHPVLLSSSLIPDLLKWNGELGLRGFLSSQKDNKETENVDDEGTVFDIDDNEDFLKLSYYKMLG